MKTFPFKAIYPNTELLVSQVSFFNSMYTDYTKHYEAGFFKSCEKPAIFIYQVIDGASSYRGIINTTDIEELISGRIIAHEDTIPTKEQNMVQETLTRKAIVKPIVMFHEFSEVIEQKINAVIRRDDTLYECEVEGGIIHQFWKIDEESELKEIENIFETEIDHIYIADGHHRVSTLLRLYKQQERSFSQFDFSKLLTVYFSEDKMKVYDHIKSIGILNELKPEVFMAKLSKYAEIRHAKKFKRPENKHEFIIIMNGEFYKCSWKKDVLRRFAKRDIYLSAFIMQHVVFERILEIDDLRMDKRISFLSGTSKDEELIRHSLVNKEDIMILQYPLSVTEIMTVADKGLHFPPKSTWIEPKIKSGVIGQLF